MANSTLTFANASQSVLLSTTCDTDCSDSCGNKWIQNSFTSLSEWMPSQVVRVDMVQAISELLLDEQAPLMMRWMRDMSEDPDVLDDDISVNLLLSLPFYDIASDELHFAFEVTAINSEIDNRRRKLLDNNLNLARQFPDILLAGSSPYHQTWGYNSNGDVVVMGNSVSVTDIHTISYLP